MAAEMPSDQWVTLDRKRLFANPDFLPLLRANQLDTFAAVMSLGSGDIVRSVPGRTTVRLKLASTGDTPIVMYLKRYGPAYLSAKRVLLRVVQSPHGREEALQEWRMMHVLRAHGISTATPIAAGQSTTMGIATRSFVMAAEIENGISASDLLPTLRGSQRRRFVEKLAEFTRHFHQQGFIHKDYYLSHLLATGNAEELRLSIIDLQRVLGPGRFLRRWLIKDIGSLAFSAVKVGATRSDLMAFYKTYTGNSQLSESDREFIWRITKRSEWLRNRTPRHGEAVRIKQPWSGTQTS